MKEFLKFMLGVFLGLAGFVGISHGIKLYGGANKKENIKFADTSINIDSSYTQKNTSSEKNTSSYYTGSSYRNHRSKKSSYKSSSSGSWVKGSYDRRGHYRKAHYRKKYSSSPHAYKNRMRSRVYYHTKGKYRRKHY